MTMPSPADRLFQELTDSLQVLAVLSTVQTVAGSQGSPRLGGHGGNQVDMGTDGIKEETLNSQTINMEFVEELKLVAVNNTAEYSRVGYFDTRQVIGVVTEIVGSTEAGYELRRKLESGDF